MASLPMQCRVNSQLQKVVWSFPVISCVRPFRNLHAKALLGESFSIVGETHFKKAILHSEIQRVARSLNTLIATWTDSTKDAEHRSALCYDDCYLMR